MNTQKNVKKITFLHKYNISFFSMIILYAKAFRTGACWINKPKNCCRVGIVSISLSIHNNITNDSTQHMTDNYKTR